jgi:hypothetical protein
MSDIYQQLSDSFPPEMVRSINKNGTNLTYIPVTEVTNRLNKVLGVGKWSRTVVKCERDAIDTDWIVAHVRIDWYATDGSVAISRDGIDAAKIMRTKQSQIVDLGDAYKSAESNAFKKAAQSLGVGLYLSRTDDAIEIEQVMEAEIVAASEPPSPSKMTWESFMSISKGLSKDQKEQLRSAWAQWSDGKPTPTKDTVTEEQANFLLTEATRLTFGGTIIEAPAK